VISLVGIAHGTSHFFHLVLPSLYPWLMRDFDLSFTQVGFLATVFFVVSGIGQALAGFVVDRIGARRVLMFGVGMLALGAFVVGLATSYPVLALGAAFAGLGNAVFHPADFTLLNRLVGPPRLGHAFSVHALIGNIGWALTPVFVTTLAGIWSWQVAAFGATGVGVTVLALLLIRREALDDRDLEEVVARTGAKRVAGSQFAFLGSMAVWLSFAFFFLSTAAFGILQNYGPTVLGHVYGIALKTASICLTTYMLGSACGTVVGGFAATRYSDSDRVVAVMLGFAALSALVLASGIFPSWAVFIWMALMGFGGGVAGPSRDLLVRKAATAQFGTNSFGRVYGFVYSGLDVGLACTPVIIGPLLDAGQFSVALYAIAVFQAGALLAVLLVGVKARAEVGVTVKG
jgi:MFS transporter, FSR family, fosmidomycin resistance protein